MITSLPKGDRLENVTDYSFGSFNDNIQCVIFICSHCHCFILVLVFIFLRDVTYIARAEIRVIGKDVPDISIA